MNTPYDTLVQLNTRLAALALDHAPIPREESASLRAAVDALLADWVPRSAGCRGNAGAIARELIYAAGIFLVAGARADAEHCRLQAVAHTPKPRARSALENAAGWPEWFLAGCENAWSYALDRDLDRAESDALEVAGRYSDADIKAFILTSSW